MKKLKIETLGYYIPAFFFLEVGTNENLDEIENLPDKVKATFSHEYIHFLQDLFTNYGLRNITHIVDILKTLNQEILKNKKKEIEVPVEIPEDGVANINIELENLYLGDYEFDFQFDQIIDILIEPNNTIENYEGVPIVQMNVLNSQTSERSSFNFGALCVIESMAYVIESQLFNNDPAPDFPYRIVEKTINHIWSAINKPDIIIALCEVALNSYNPGHFFVDILYRMQNQGFTPKTPTDIYKFSEGYSAEINGRVLSHNELFEEQSTVAEVSLKDYFTTDYYNPIKSWVSDIFSKTRNLKSNSKFNFASIIEGTKSERQNRFLSVVNYLGIPVMSNSKNQFWSTHDAKQLIMFRAIVEIQNVLIYGNKCCELKGFCSQAPQGDITNSFCDTEPWKRSTMENLCPFGQMWKLWGLHEKQIR